MGAVSATFTIDYNPSVITLTQITLGSVGTSNGGGRNLSFNSPTPGTLNISITGVNQFVGSGALVNLDFNVTGLPGAVSDVVFTTFQYNNGPPCGTADDGSVTVIAGTISGTVTYGNVSAPPAPRHVPGVLISGAGSPLVSTMSVWPAGGYALNGFGPGTYVVTPSKGNGTDTNGAVNGFDAARITQYVVDLYPLNSTQLAAANVSGTGGVSSFDATLIARHIVSLGPPTGSTANWIFTPSSVTYSAIFNNIANQNYSALLMGDVTGNWNHPNSAPSRPANIGPVRSTAIKAPHVVTPADTDVIIPLSINGAADKDIISYEFDLRYDPSVIQPQANPVNVAGTVSRGLTAIANSAQPGLLKVAVFGPMHIDADGILLNLKFSAVGKPGSVSPLTWERIMFNEGEPQATATDGRIEISTATHDQAEISGRLLTGFGAGVPNARVTLTDTAGETRTAISNGFGMYRFGGVQVGQTYTISVRSRWTFEPITVSVTGQMQSVDMIAGQ